MVDPTLPLPGLSPIAEKAIVARFDGGQLSSDGGLLVLRQIERRLSVADRLAACIDDPRDPASTVHTLADIIRFRLLMIAAGYEDANDATGLRLDPLFKMALERRCGARTCVRSRPSRGWRTCPTHGHCCAWAGPWSTFTAPRSARCRGASVPISTTPSTRSTAASNCGCSMPITTTTVFSRSSSSSGWSLRHRRPAPGETTERRRDQGCSAAWSARSAPPGRRWKCRRADSHYACPREVRRLVRGERPRLYPGLAPTSTLKRHVGGLEASTSARFKADPTAAKVRRSRNSVTPPAAGAPGSAVFVPASRPAATAPTRFIVTDLGTASPMAVPGPLLPARTPEKTTSRLGNRTSPPTGPGVQGHRQPVPPVPARRRLLAAVEPARADAQGLVLAGRPVRHAQAAPRPRSRPCRRNEDEDQVDLPTSAQAIDLRLVLGRLPRLVA